MFSFRSVFRRFVAPPVSLMEREARARIEAGHDPMDVWIDARGLDINSDTAKEYKKAYKDKDSQQLVYACRGLKIIPLQFLKKSEQINPVPGYIMDATILLRDLDGVNGQHNGAIVNFVLQEQKKMKILGDFPRHMSDKKNLAYMEEAVKFYNHRNPVAAATEFKNVEDVHFYLNDACVFFEAHTVKKREGLWSANKAEAISASVWVHEKKLSKKQEERRAIERKKQEEEKEAALRQSERRTELFTKAYANCYFEEWSLKRERAPAVSKETFFARFAPPSQSGSGIPSNSL